MVYCEKCGKKLGNEESFCPNCNTKTDYGKEKERAEKKRKEEAKKLEQKKKQEKERLEEKKRIEREEREARLRAKKRKEFFLENKLWFIVGGLIVAFLVLFVLLVPLPYTATEHRIKTVSYTTQQAYTEQQPYTETISPESDVGMQMYIAYTGQGQNAGDTKYDYQIHSNNYDTVYGCVSFIITLLKDGVLVSERPREEICLNAGKEYVSPEQSFSLPEPISSYRTPFYEVRDDTYDVRVSSKQETQNVQRTRSITKYKDVTKYKEEATDVQVTKKATLFQRWTGRARYWYEVRE